jgi:hypothetical protein
MGLWGAAQAIGFAVGGVAGAAASDLARWLLGSQVAPTGWCLPLEALLFVVAAGWRFASPCRHPPQVGPQPTPRERPRRRCPG